MPRMRLLLVLVAVVGLGALARAQERDLSDVDIDINKITDQVYWLEGAGGNIGLLTGPDGVLLIDDQFAQLTDKINASVAEVSTKPVRYILNTHFHGDHVGSNENFGRAGVTIIAQDKVRARLSTKQFNKLRNVEVPPLASVGLPILTFNDSLTFHMNGQTVIVFHVAPAHTDGDAIVLFKEANVVHMGDCFFNGNYPIIDLGAGGSFTGMIAAVDRVLPRIDDRTKVIPGHGELGDKASLKAFRDMLVEVRDKVRPLVKQGKTADQIVAAKPTAALDAKWGKGFMTPERFLRVVAEDLGAKGAR